MTDQELREAIADKQDYERDFFVPIGSDELHDAECAAIPPYIELLGRQGAETFLQSLTTIENWSKEHNSW